MSAGAIATGRPTGGNGTMSRQTRTSESSDNTRGQLDEKRRVRVELSVDEAAEVYANEWIFMEVTERDEFDAAARGIILDHHPRQDGIDATITEVIAEVKAGIVPDHVRGYYVFYGVRLFRTKAEWNEYKRQTGWPEGDYGRSL
jgi:hypothetical protein